MRGWRGQRAGRRGVRGAAGRVVGVRQQPLPHGGGVLGLGFGTINALIFALQADTVEYGEWRTGVRTEGTTYALFSFTRKMGQALGGFVGGFALTWAGFSATQASAGAAQDPGVSDNIQLFAGGLVGGFCLLSIAVMYFYPLTEQKFRDITAEIAERRAATTAH